MATVTLRNVSKSFDSVAVLKDINLDIREREFVVFVGPSGCGKTTLLRLIAGLEDSCEGEIFIDNQLVNHIPPAKRKLAMVFQSYALYPHMTVYDNMGFGLKVSRYSREDIRERVLNAARILQIENLLERKPKQLSGGQRQRVAIGRAIVREPRVFLFDEPLSNLDTSLRVQMRNELATLKAQLKTTMIYVTHDQTEAMTLADRIVVLRDGYVEQVGPPLELYHNPCNQFVASFIGSPQMNFLPMQVLSSTHNSIMLDLFPGVDLSFSGLAEGEKVTLGIRPEHMQITQEDKLPSFLRLTGYLERIEHLGSESHCYVTIANKSTIVVKSANAENLAPGQDITLALPLPSCHLFDKNGKALTPNSFDTVFRKNSA